MNILERAARLRTEADQVMELIGLAGILHPYGEITFSGSYFLDVMVYPDIDLYIPKITLEAGGLPTGHPGGVREIQRPNPAERVVHQTSHPVRRLGSALEDRYLVAVGGGHQRKETGNAVIPTQDDPLASRADPAL